MGSQEELRAAAHLMDKVALHERRGRELYKYLQADNLLPPQLQRRSSTLDIAENGPTLNDGLAPFVQLAALRCNAQKAMLNFVDKDVLYFLAEASGAPVDDETEPVEDVIFLGCSGVPLTGRICEMTVELEATPNQREQPAMFVVPDLSKDSRFSSLPFVQHVPHYRFYAGTPIITPDGMNIGSLAVMDFKPRGGLTRLESSTLGETAAHVMSYLDTHRQAIEGRRTQKMGRGFDCFMAGKRTLNEDTKELSDKTSKRTFRAVYGLSPPFDEEDIEATTPKSPRSKGRYARRRTNTTQSSSSRESVTCNSDEKVSGQSSDSESYSQQEDNYDSRSHLTTFARAANLIRESFELGDESGVHFFKIKNDLQRKTTLHDTRRQSTTKILQFPTPNGLKRSLTSDELTDHPAPIVASSTPAAPFADEGDANRSTIHVGEGLLLEASKRYRGGTLWSFNRSPNLSSSDEEFQLHRNPTAKALRRRSRGSRKKRRVERESILKAFPNARQVLFTPLWDSANAAFTHAVFVWTSDDTRSLSTTAYQTFLKSFCSTVMAECSRLEITLADKQKSDFVGTISHEMRSPLHGLLASCEFLDETELNPFQKSLVDTISTCGVTLLDTINHVLDYSKINSFMTSNETASRAKKRNHTQGREFTAKSFSGAPPLLQLSGATDISAVLEEVIDGIALGQTYVSGLDITDMSRKARGRAGRLPAHQTAEIAKESVKVILDVQQADWVFMTQPGAVRRIIMNIYGNSMKYTSSGTIHVKLQLKSSNSKDSEAEVMILTVTDTGRGISPEFLNSKIFMPFAQENALAPGTGLGLSIVRSIVTMLGGEIDITSQVGEGTTVQVVLPLTRALPGSQSTTQTPHTGGSANSTGSAPDNSVDLLRTQAPNCRVALAGFDKFEESSKADEDLSQILSRYIRDWYGLELVEQELAASASIVIVEEQNLELLIDRLIDTPGSRPALIVLCSVAGRHSRTLNAKAESCTNRTVEFIAKPCGPYKLASSIRTILDRERSKLQRSSVLDVPSTLDAVIELPIPRTPVIHTESCSDKLQEMDLGIPGNNNVLAMIQGNEIFAVSQTSQNAQMAINDPASSSTRSSEGDDTEKHAFPFPHQNDPNLAGQQSLFDRSGASKEMSVLTDGFKNASMTANIASSERVDPRILLVDDNQINLRLLQTYLKVKRKYDQIEIAEDGQLAINAVTSALQPFDVIFMDISMPVMNGFEATRAIRDFEASNNVKPSAMVIALTGLASGRDQSEGFNSGCDIYMTKPVSFKEVGKLLDNWEAHQKLKVNGESRC